MSAKVVETEALWRWGIRLVLAALLAGALLGSLLTHYLYDVTHVPQEAMRQAREVVDAEMRAACSNWFTDKRSKDLPPGRVVVCKAPAFMNNPLVSSELK